MSNKVANAKWVWLKGGLFLLIGALGSTILILHHPDSLTMVLLLAIVWSFCRAYHTAIYATERYVDPGFKYMGLFSFWDYMFDQSSRSKDTISRPRYSCDDVARNSYLIKSMLLNWIVIATLGCIFLPTVFEELMMQLRPRGFTDSKMIVLLPPVAHGLGTSLFAALAVFAGLASWSIRYRIPVASTLLLIFCSCYYLGLQDQRMAVSFCFVWPGAVFLITFGMCCLARWSRGWRLVPCSSLSTGSSSARPRANWDINYLFLVTTLAAVCISLVGSIMPQSAARIRFVAPQVGLGALVAIAVVAHCCVFLLFATRRTFAGKWPLVFCVLVMALGPLVLTLIMSLSAGKLGNLFSSIRGPYAFQFGLVLGLSVLFTSARLAEIRLCTRRDASALSKQNEQPN